MTGREAQRLARISGILYLVVIALGAVDELALRAHLIVAGDPAATLQNLILHPLAFRASIAGDIVMHLCDLPGILIFWLLLRPVSPRWAALAALFNLVQTAVLVANKSTLIAAALTAASAVNMQQPAQTVALLLDLHNYGFAVGLIFFAVCCLITGWLMLRSSYFPTWVAACQAIAGFFYLVDCFALILAPEWQAHLVPWILLFPFVGELATALYLTVAGLNVRQWDEHTQAVAS